MSSLIQAFDKLFVKNVEEVNNEDNASSVSSVAGGGGAKAANK